MSNYVKQTNTTNNYLDLVISELKNFPQSNSEILNLIQSKKNVYNRFKREFIKNINNIKNKNLKAFALLAASTIQDDDFLNTITKKFDYDLINNDLATFAKGIYNLYLKNYEQATNLLWNAFIKNKKYFCECDIIHLIQLIQKYYCNIRKKRQKAKYIFWKIFAEVSPDYFSKEGFLFLINLLTESSDNNDIQNCDILVKYCTSKYNNDIDFEIEQAKSQIANENNNTYYKSKHNYNIEFLLNNSNNINDLYDLYNKCFFTFAEEDNFYKFVEKTILSIKYSEVIDNNNENKFLYNQKLRLDDINEIIDILESIGEKPFLDGGTLLGFYRNGKIMSYDADADLGLLIDDEKRKNITNYIFKIIDSIYKNSNKFNFKVINSEGTFSSISIGNVELNTHIDLGFFHKHYFDENFNDINKCFLGAKTKLNTLMWEFDDFNLVRKKFANKEYWIPENPEHFLEQLYGKDWKIPNSLWISMLSCPNLSKKSKLYVCNFGINYLIGYLRKNNYEKSNYVYKELQRWDYPFTDEMKNHIENYLQQIKANQK